MTYQRDIWFARQFAWIMIISATSGTACLFTMAGVNFGWSFKEDVSDIIDFLTKIPLRLVPGVIWFAVPWAIILPAIVESRLPCMIIYGILLPMYVPAMVAVVSGGNTYLVWVVIVFWYICLPCGAIVGIATWFVLLSYRRQSRQGE